MKKIVGLTIAAILILALAGTGTWAFFRDTETSSGSLTAGTLDLQVDATSTEVTTFTATDIMPGDSESGTTELTNNGSVNGLLFASASAVTNTETTVEEFNDGGAGELGGAVEMAIYIDVNNNDLYDAGDIGLKNDGSTYTTALDFQTVNSYGGKSWGDTAGIETLNSQASDIFHVDWRFPETGEDQSSCQGDSLSISFTFDLKQS